MAELGARARFAAADVTRPEQLEAAVQLAAAAPGGLRISVHCAGIVHAERTARERGPHRAETFERVIGVNLVGTFHALRLASAAMLAGKPGPAGERGVIVNTASIAAFDGQIGQIAYAASKGGVVALTLPAARDLAASGIRVCAIAPGLFDTPLLAGLPAEAREQLAASVPYPPRLGIPRSSPSSCATSSKRHAQRRGGAARRGVADGAGAERRPRTALIAAVVIAIAPARGRRAGGGGEPRARAARADPHVPRDRACPGGRACAVAVGHAGRVCIPGTRAAARGLPRRHAASGLGGVAPRTSLPRRPVVLSFDDGYASQVRNALPALRRAGWPGVLTSRCATCRSRRRERGPADGPRGLGGRLAHADPPRPDDADGRRAGRELRDSRARIRRLFGEPASFSAIRQAATTPASSPP